MCDVQSRHGAYQTISKEFELDADVYIPISVWYRHIMQEKLRAAQLDTRLVNNNVVATITMAVMIGDCVKVHNKPCISATHDLVGLVGEVTQVSWHWIMIRTDEGKPQGINLNGFDLEMVDPWANS